MKDNEGDKECNSETKKMGLEKCQVAPGVRPEKGHLAQSLK
jgi:hypothetical protein